MRSERDGGTSLVEDDEESLEEDVSQDLDAAGVVGLQAAIACYSS